jgi:hypothetical protein
MACIALAVVPLDGSLAAKLLRLTAWGGMAKGTALILAPQLIGSMAKWLEHAGILNVVLAGCIAVGAFFTWYGYIGRRAEGVELDGREGGPATSSASAAAIPLRRHPSRSTRPQ